MGAGNFSLHHCVQTKFLAHPVSYPLVTRGSFSRVKGGRAWSWPLTSIWGEFKNAWSYTSTLPYVFMAWCLVKYRLRLHCIMFSSAQWLYLYFTLLYFQLVQSYHKTLHVTSPVCFGSRHQSKSLAGLACGKLKYELKTTYN